MDLIDVRPIEAGYGQVWQGSEWDAVFSTIPKPRLFVSLIGESEPFRQASLTAFLEDNDQDTLADITLLAMATSVTAYLQTGHNVLIHCFQGKYRSTYLDVAVHMLMGMQFEDAYSLVRQRRTIALLRQGTRSQLQRMAPLLVPHGSE